MAINNAPIFPQTPKSGFTTLTTVDATATKNHNGTGASTVSVFTAGGYGARIDTITAVALGTNTASVIRVFINNGTDHTVSTNNVLYWETSLAATTLSEVAALAPVTITMNVAIPANYQIYVCLGTAVAAGWCVTCAGGNY